MATRQTRRVTARYYLARLRVSFWFVPMIMALVGTLLAWAMYWVDLRIPNELLQESRFILSGPPDVLRAMLISMASTILATAGVVFTLLTLPLSTVASQYGSRLLRVFLADRTTQLVLGTFVATFAYCLAAALSILPTEIDPNGPQITATVGLVLMLATFGSLILLVQHVSTMLQAPNIAAAAGAELRDVVRAEIPEQLVRADNLTGGSEIQPESLSEEDAYPIRTRQAGYIQYIDPHYLLTVAQEHDLVVQLLRKPGHVVWTNARVALVWPASRVNAEMDRQIRNAFRIGNGRTPTQDVAYAANQLVEMATRAMSPAINDPYTAMTCLDYIGESLALFVQQGEKAPYYYDRDNKLRVILEPVTFAELLSGSFDMLRHCSCNNATVLLHMLEVIETIDQEARSPAASRELLRHVSLILAESHVGDLIEHDRQLIQRRAEALLAMLNSEVGETSSVEAVTA